VDSQYRLYTREFMRKSLCTLSIRPLSASPLAHPSGSGSSGTRDVSEEPMIRPQSHRVRAASLLFGVLTTVLAAGQAGAHPDNPPDAHAGDPPAFLTCTDCHNSYPLNSGDGGLSIQGLPAGYAPGTAYPLTIVLSDPGQRRWGFEATVIKPTGGLQAGTLASVDARYTQVSLGSGTLRDYIKQTLQGTFAGQTDAASWQILWTAPAAGTGPAHFYLAGNAANNSGTPFGDYVYAIDTEIPELAPTGVSTQPVEQTLLSLGGPNPIRAGGEIRLQLPEAASVRLEVVDPLGRSIRNLVAGSLTAGTHIRTWDTRDGHGAPVPAGVYFYVLQTGRERVTRAVTVVR
jgi:hypothetical protein